MVNLIFYVVCELRVETKVKLDVDKGRPYEARTTWIGAPLGIFLDFDEAKKWSDGLKRETTITSVGARMHIGLQEYT